MIEEMISKIMIQMNILMILEITLLEEKVIREVSLEEIIMRMKKMRIMSLEEEEEVEKMYMMKKMMII